MIYLIIVGVLLFGIALFATIYCTFVFSAMLEDIDTLHYDAQVNHQSMTVIGSKFNLCNKT